MFTVSVYFAASIITSVSTCARHVSILHLCVAKLHTVNLPGAVTLGGVYDGGEASTGSRDLLQWAVGLQQQWQHMIILLNAEVAE